MRLEKMLVSMVVGSMCRTVCLHDRKWADDRQVRQMEGQLHLLERGRTRLDVPGWDCRPGQLHGPGRPWVHAWETGCGCEEADGLV